MSGPPQQRTLQWTEQKSQADITGTALESMQIVVREEYVYRSRAALSWPEARTVGRQRAADCGYPVSLQTKHVDGHRKQIPRKRWMKGICWVCVCSNLYRININYMAMHFCESVRFPGFHADLKQMLK